MVDTIKCDHCGAEVNVKYVVTKEFDGKVINFCCRGCLQVYEMLREENSDSQTQGGQNSDLNKDS